MAYIQDPLNSYEVSYVLSIRKPSFNTGISKEDCFRIIGKDRARELNTWAYKFFSHKWFIDHIVWRPYIRPEILP